MTPGVGSLAHCDGLADQRRITIAGFNSCRLLGIVAPLYVWEALKWTVLLPATGETKGDGQR